tara:strand:+ start:182 stop:406 length:225 start_codon:yes stop_codon:yes gene_type:complete
MEDKIKEPEGWVDAGEIARYLRVPTNSISYAAFLLKIPHLQIPYLINNDGRRPSFHTRFLLSDVLKALAQEVIK